MNKTVFYARRTDGLGERFRALLNAIALSKVYGADFKFTWKGNLAGSHFQATETAERIFAPTFLSKHLVDSESARQCDNVIEFLKSRRPGSYFCDQVIPVRDASFVVDQVDIERYKGELKKAFWDIEFSDSIGDSILAAHGVRIDSPTVAVHLRAGDLIYDRFKHAVSYLGKAIPFPIAEKIIEHAKGENWRVIVFGQDRDLLSYYSDRWGLDLATELMPYDMGKVEAAIFDVVLMSRCNKIYAGNSGFSVLSSIIGGGDYVHYFDFLELDERVSLICRSLLQGAVDSNVSGPQIAYACKAALVEGFGTLDDAKFRGLADIGRKADVDSVLFDFMEAWRFFAKGDFSSGNAVARVLTSSRKMALLEFLKFNTGSPHQRRVFNRLFNVDVLSVHENEGAAWQLYSMFKKSIERS